MGWCDLERVFEIEGPNSCAEDVLYDVNVGKRRGGAEISEQ